MKLSDLPNIGKVLEEKLNAVGIFTYEDLKNSGSINTIIRISETTDAGCFNMLYALEGAIRGVRWHHLPKEVIESLKAELLGLE